MAPDKQHGGRRPGAGRKPLTPGEHRESMTFSVSPTTKRMAAELRKDGVDINSLVCHIIAVEYERRYGEFDTQKMDNASERYLHEPK